MQYWIKAQSIKKISRSLYGWNSNNNSKTYETNLPSKRGPNNPCKLRALTEVGHGSLCSVNIAVHTQLPSGKSQRGIQFEKRYLVQVFWVDTSSQGWCRWDVLRQWLSGIFPVGLTRTNNFKRIFRERQSNKIPGQYSLKLPRSFGGKCHS